MKAITKEITETKTVGYEANDGTFFNNKEECEKYESTCRCVIMSAFKGLVKGTADMCHLLDGFGSTEDDIYLVEINSANDLEIVNKALALWNVNLVSKDYIYKTVMIEKGWDGELWSIGTIDEFIGEIKERYNNALKVEDKNAT